MDETAQQNSSSKIILSIIVILVIAAIAFALARSNGDDNGTATTTPDGTNGTSSEETAFTGDFFALASRGGDWKCTWSSEQSGVSLDGTVYVSNGKFRSEAEISGTGINTTAYTVGDGAYVYMWQNAATTGVKVPMTQGAAALEAPGTTQNVQLAGEYNYDCDPWIADAGRFAVPTDVSFQEAAAVN